jgi:hypothetical protein
MACYGDSFTFFTGARINCEKKNFLFICALRSYRCVLGVGLDWVHLLRRQSFGLLYQPRMTDDDECGAVKWLARETEVKGENLPQYRFIHHKSQIWSGLEPIPPRWEAGDYPAELRHSLCSYRCWFSYFVSLSCLFHKKTAANLTHVIRRVY